MSKRRVLVLSQWSQGTATISTSVRLIGPGSSVLIRISRT